MFNLNNPLIKFFNQLFCFGSAVFVSFFAVVFCFDKYALFALLTGFASVGLSYWSFLIYKKKGIGIHSFRTICLIDLWACLLCFLSFIFFRTNGLPGMFSFLKALLKFTSFIGFIWSIYLFFYILPRVISSKTIQETFSQEYQTPKNEKKTSTEKSSSNKVDLDNVIEVEVKDKE